jgi:hypothetical protein
MLVPRRTHVGTSKMLDGVFVFTATGVLVVAAAVTPLWPCWRKQT